MVQNIDNSAASQKLSLKVLHDYIPAYLKLLRDLQCVALNHAIGLDYFDELKKEEEIFYQQTFVDTYSKVANCKLYTSKTPITAADLLNDRVLPFFEEHDMGILRMLTDRGTEYCGKVKQHDYELYLGSYGI